MDNTAKTQKQPKGISDRTSDIIMVAYPLYRHHTQGSDTLYAGAGTN